MRGVRVTIEDVAREASVSIATVSCFTNGHEGAMSETTQARLQEIVERLSYILNSAAQTLKTGRSKLIGVVLADIAHFYWSSMLGRGPKPLRLYVSQAEDRWPIAEPCQRWASY